jgi:sulfite reductase alpha subunit-like flavoprotein
VSSCDPLSRLPVFHCGMPSQGDGVPPSEAREFCDWLAGSSAPRLEQLHFSVCALGDT